MTTKILLPIDHTDETSWKKALPVALEQAKFYGAELEVMSVIPEIIKLPNLPANYGEGAKGYVEGAVRHILFQAGANVPQVHIKQGSVYREIIKLAHQGEFDMIIMRLPKVNFRISKWAPISPASFEMRIAL